ncbi:MAG: dipeptidyl carboxypeptidase II, partial [Proteobacteria bacterium]|nr:dipeptidyl carboxypeptidase II [Pseudomonadota bacterium]
MKSSLSLLALALTGLVAGCTGAPDASDSKANATSSSATTASANPFFTESPLALHFPQFDQITDADYAPAFDRGMADQLKEVDAIAGNAEAPTFDNTILALEKSGQILDRATTVFFSLSGVENNDAKKAIQKEYAPKLAAHRDAISLNPQLFARVQKLYDTRNDL